MEGVAAHEQEKLFIRILVKLLIAVTLTVIWKAKTHPTPIVLDENISQEHVSAENEGDFALESTAMNLETLTSYKLPALRVSSAACFPRPVPRRY